jgi:hypothetical protein
VKLLDCSAELDASKAIWKTFCHGDLLKPALNALEAQHSAALRSAGSESAAKPHIFVAMPFAKEMEDIYHYGISGARLADSTYWGRALSGLRFELLSLASGVTIAAIEGPLYGESDARQTASRTGCFSRGGNRCLWKTVHRHERADVAGA